MHTTASVDFEVVLAGEVWLELDDGAAVLLKPGDTVVQNGTRHAWRNRSDAPARLVAFLVGAHHANVQRSRAGVAEGDVARTNSLRSHGPCERGARS